MIKLLACAFLLYLCYKIAEFICLKIIYKKKKKGKWIKWKIKF